MCGVTGGVEIEAYCRLLFVDNFPIICVLYDNGCDESMQFCRGARSRLHDIDFSLNLKELSVAARMKESHFHGLWPDRLARGGYFINGGATTFGAAAFAYNGQQYLQAMAFSILIGLAAFNGEDFDFFLDYERKDVPGIFKYDIVWNIKGWTEGELPSFFSTSSVLPVACWNTSWLPASLSVCPGDVVLAWFQTSWFEASIISVPVVIHTNIHKMSLSRESMNVQRTATVLVRWNMDQSTSELPFSHIRKPQENGSVEEKLLPMATYPHAK